MSFVVWVVLDLPPTVHVVEVSEPVSLSAYAEVVDDIDEIRPAAVEALIVRLIGELTAHQALLASALDEDEWYEAHAGLLLFELYLSYACPDDGFTLQLDAAAADVYRAHGIDPLLWGWTISDRGGDAAAG